MRKLKNKFLNFKASFEIQTLRRSDFPSPACRRKMAVPLLACRKKWKMSSIYGSDRKSTLSLSVLDCSRSRLMETRSSRRMRWAFFDDPFSAETTKSTEMQKCDVRRARWCEIGRSLVEFLFSLDDKRRSVAASSSFPLGGILQRVLRCFLRLSKSPRVIKSSRKWLMTPAYASPFGEFYLRSIGISRIWKE